MRLIVGLGNPSRRDDGFGPRLVHALEEGTALPSDVRTTALVDPLDLLEQWRACDAVVIVDAVSSGAPPGTLHHILWDEPGVVCPRAVVSSHGMGAPEVAALARALGELPPRLELIGVEGADFGDGEGLTPPVEAALGPATRAVRNALGL
jgi:hydrogenase maturation protease